MIDSQVKASGIFTVRYESGETVDFKNAVTADGLQRIAELTAGISGEPWNAMRLVGALAETLQKETSKTVSGPELKSEALFTASERGWEAVTAEIYAGSTLMATATVSIPAAQTVYITHTLSLV